MRSKSKLADGRITLAELQERTRQMSQPTAPGSASGSFLATNHSIDDRGPSTIVGPHVFISAFVSSGFVTRVQALAIGFNVGGFGASSQKDHDRKNSEKLCHHWDMHLRKLVSSQFGVVNLGYLPSASKKNRELLPAYLACSRVSVKPVITTSPLSLTCHSHP